MMTYPTCGSCRFMRADEKGQGACFGAPPHPKPSPTYRWGNPLDSISIADPVYPRVSSITPACGGYKERA